MADLHDEIDELAVEIEQQIQRAKRVNEEYQDQFDPKYRMMEQDAEALFS